MTYSARWGILVGIFFVFSALSYFFNVTPWFFFALVGYLAWSTFRNLSTNSSAIPGTILGLFFAISVWQYISPLTGLQLQVSNFFFLSFLGLIFAILNLKFTVERQFSSIRQHILFIPYSLVTAVTIFFMIWFQLSPTPHLSFSMNGDAVWNTVTARFVIADGGIVPSRHPNPAPLTAELLALVDAPGRHLVSTQNLLLHDVMRQSQLWFVLLCATSVVIMALVALMLRGASRLLTQVVAVLAGLLSYSWFFSGFSFFFGFYNATIAILVLLACWHVWLQSKKHPPLSLILLSAGSVVLLATWAPLVVITGSLMIALVIIQGWGYWFTQKIQRTIALICASLIPVTYFAMFTLADLLREGPALSVDGGIFEFSPFLLILLPILITALTIKTWNLKYTRQSFWGVFSIVLGGGFGLGYLLWQRKDASLLWGYYPVKFSWLFAGLLIVILLTLILQWPDFSSKSLMTTSAFLIMIATAVIALMFLARPLGITEIFSPAAVIFSKGVGANDSVVPEISQLASEKELIVVVNYGDSKQQDLFMNNWLLQLPADRPDSIMRWYSYYLDGSDLELVCTARTDLKQSLQVVTRDILLTSQLEQLCNDENISVRVVK